MAFRTSDLLVSVMASDGCPAPSRGQCPPPSKPQCPPPSCGNGSEQQTAGCVRPPSDGLLVLREQLRLSVNGFQLRQSLGQATA